MYEHDYTFLTTYHNGKVLEKMGNGEMKVAGQVKLPAMIFYGQIKQVLI